MATTIAQNFEQTFFHNEAIHQWENSLDVSVASPKSSTMRINQSVSAVKKRCVQGPSAAGKQDFSLAFDVSVSNAKCPRSLSDLEVSRRQTRGGRDSKSSRSKNLDVFFFFFHSG